MIIAVDGPVAAGKGTLARQLAAALNLVYLDTGLIYRAVAARVLSEGALPGDEATAAKVAGNLRPEDLERPDLRREGVGQAASIVSSLPAVRAALLAYQRDFAESPPEDKVGAVLDGRDVGTVVCPDADIKFFITASAEARAERRHKELLARGEESIYARVLEDLKERDARDSQRAAAPLKAAEDAITLDTTDMPIETAFAAMMDIISQRRNARGR